jgi:hypothetical protein
MDRSLSTLKHKRVRNRVLHDDIGRSKYPSFSSANARASQQTGATIISRINFMSIPRPERAASLSTGFR